ncbi:MAG: adenylate/guanylate cyclase domain-containing protein [Chromatiales bacterium]
MPAGRFLFFDDTFPGRLKGGLRRHSWRILLVFAVFVAFIFNAAGLIGLQLDFGTGFQFRGNILSQILSRGSLPDFMRSADFAVLAASGAVLSLLLPILTPIKASLVTVLFMVPPVWLAYTQPARSQVIPMEYTLLTILVLYTVNVLASYFSETHARQKLIGIFGHYVPPELAQVIARSPDSFSLEGEQREMTVFFCDIKNFSALSEQMDPRQLARMLNRYFTAMTDILHQHGATIDKYIGDAIMAFWGAPVVQPDHARRAVLAALAMQEGVRRMRRQFRDQGWPELDIGIGINTGVMNVGNMGSRYRVAYTVVGDAVNLCSRTERLTRVYNVCILVSESTMATVSDAIFKEIDFVRVRGKGSPTRVFEALCRTEQVSKGLIDNLALHQRALAAYYRQEWDQAELLFMKLRDIEFNREYCMLMLRRIGFFRQVPPPSDWMGVTNYTRRPTD